MTAPAAARHVFLIGFPAAGKTTVGALVAAALGRGFTDLDEVVKDRAAFPTFTSTLAIAMRGELERTLSDLALDPARDVREMFDTRTTFLNKDLATLYKVTGPTGATFQAATLPTVRGGVLTMAGMATLLANNLRSSPTRRGVFIRERLLCEDVPPPPANVVTDLNSAPVTAASRVSA